jgi:dihydroorotate dehydrogenase (NAD+) catalytic subunit
MKRDLFFRMPVINAAGTLGFAPDTRAPAPWDALGAFVTNPISLRPRRPTARPDLIEYPGGILLHTGLPNPGFSATLKKHASRWAKTNLPVIVHLMADRPQETAKMVATLEGRDNVMAAELGFAPQLAGDILLMTLEMCLGELPLIFALPPEQVLSLGPRLIQAGAAAISIAAPRGALSSPLPLEEEGPGVRALVRGRLYGPSLFPQSLSLVRDAARIGLPVIGAGGVWTMENARAMMEAGALAVQADAALWGFNFISQAKS